MAHLYRRTRLFSTAVAFSSYSEISPVSRSAPSRHPHLPRSRERPTNQRIFSLLLLGFGVLAASFVGSSAIMLLVKLAEVLDEHLAAVPDAAVAAVTAVAAVAAAAAAAAAAAVAVATASSSAVVARCRFRTAWKSSKVMDTVEWQVACKVASEAGSKYDKSQKYLVVI